MTRLLPVVLVVLVAMPNYGTPESAIAQSSEVLDLYDFDEDGDVTCEDDFIPTFPRTHTDQATDAMRQFPEALDSLDRDNDGFACDNQPDPVTVAPVGRASTPSDPAPAPSAPSTAGCVIFAEVAHASACAGGPVRVGLDADEDALPVATSGTVSTGAMFSLTQRTAEQSVRTVESEQQAARRTAKKKRKATRKRQRMKERKAQRRLERQQSER